MGFGLKLQQLYNFREVLKLCNDLCCKVLLDIARLNLRLMVVEGNWIYIHFCQLMSVACISW